MSLLDDPDFTHTPVTVETRTGVGPRGDQYATAATRTVIVEDGRRQVRNADGELTLSQTRLFDHLDQAAIYTIGSKVTVNGRTALVIGTSRQVLDNGDVDHLEIVLT